jgi:quinol monooxygenase YgiN
MIIVLARAEFDPTRLDELQPALDAMMRSTWDESGCLSYSMAIENRDEGICTIVERWADEASLKSHFEKPHMAAFNQAIKGAVRSIDAKIYDVVNERPLMG